MGVSGDDGDRDTHEDYNDPAASRAGAPADAAAGGDLRISRRLTIPSAELAWRFSRAGGPGGQHVNRSETRVELRWNVAESAAPTDFQRELLLERLASRIDADGTLRVVSTDSRSQLTNRRHAAERMQALLLEALRPQRVRRKTKPSRAARERRLKAKNERSERKKDRGRKDWE